MWVTPGQLKDIQKMFPNVAKDDCEVIAEGGSDRGTFFGGAFLVRIKRKGVYRFEDGVMVKKVK